MYTFGKVNVSPMFDYYVQIFHMCHVTFRDENFELRKFVFDDDIDVLCILFNQVVSMGPRQREKAFKNL